VEPLSTNIYQNKPLDLLVGKTIKEVRLGNEKIYLIFICDDDTFLALCADGDCCSSSWIEHLNGLDFLIGHKINRVVEREMPEGHDSVEHDWLQYYGWTLETNVGRFDIEMRNASNGYYGGYLTVLDLKIPISEFPIVLEDF
jgi:hypothetical protein